MDKQKLYKLPWTREDNPNGWIEPTTYCQIKCPGCYRGLGENSRKQEHQDIESLKKEIDFLTEKRNIQSLSIAGGEPLMYPDLNLLVKYASGKGLKIKIYTNGLLLDKGRLKELKELGVTEFVIHIDRHQQRSNSFSESELNATRQRFCKMFRKEGNVNLGFIMPISKQDIGQLSSVISFFKENSDIINLVVFVVLKEMLPNKKIDPKLKLSLQELRDAVQKEFGIDYCAYLGKEHCDEISWLFSFSAYSQGKLIGSFDNNLYRIIQAGYYKRKSKYFITIPNKPLSIKKMLPWILNASVRNILFKYLRNPFKNINHQVVLLIDPPDLTEKGWDLCDGCPDAMAYNKELVPSCLLERIKSGERILIK
ncbi:MAG: radical SAM protein [Nanoarchaeota archaeon]|nr:radical SAM protein [Nanoarchaeota archaeon]MBU1946950.1 radical SAM protein [Nanoarchaeota archaeon]